LSNRVFLTPGQVVEMPEQVTEKRRESVQLWD
ncbi:phage tail protein, partial [Salmonella enterica]|nr:phage tail protein [Salmonella enterica subsp. enterica serovar Gaminara]